MFAPLPAIGRSSKLDVRMSGGFNIKGAEVAGKASTEAALDSMIEQFTISINRLGKEMG